MTKYTNDVIGRSSRLMADNVSTENLKSALSQMKQLRKDITPRFSFVDSEFVDREGIFTGLNVYEDQEVFDSDGNVAKFVDFVNALSINGDSNVTNEKIAVAFTEIHLDIPLEEFESIVSSDELIRYCRESSVSILFQEGEYADEVLIDDNGDTVYLTILSIGESYNMILSHKLSKETNELTDFAFKITPNVFMQREGQEILDLMRFSEDDIIRLQSLSKEGQRRFIDTLLNICNLE